MNTVSHSNPVKLFSLSELQNTFPGSVWGQNYLKRQGIVFCNNPREADLFFAKSFPLMWRPLLRAWWGHGLKKPLLVHTHEPRFCTLSESGPMRSWPFPEVHIMNLYTGDVHINNFSIYHWAIGKEIQSYSDTYWQKNEGAVSMVGLATYIANPVKQQLVMDGRDVDLAVRRQQLLVRGHERGMLDIYGRNWPDGFVVGKSARDDWHPAKMQILNRYRFNVAIENTAWPHYCSEKIWDAIVGGCLPIYWGDGTAIYEDFPRESFLDYADYSGPDQLFDHVEQMTKAEYDERMGRCIDVYNAVVKRLDGKQEREGVLALFAARVWQIMGRRRTAGQQ